MYKNQIDDARVGAHESIKQFMEMEDDIMEETKDLIVKLGSLSWRRISK